MTERVLLPLRQRHAQHQTDADSQRHRNFKGADALGKGKGVFVLDEIVGGVVDACARHKRENAGQQKHRDRRFLGNGKHAGKDGKRNDRQQGGRGGVCAQQGQQLVPQPAHSAYQRAVGQAAPGARKQDGKAQRARCGQKKLRGQLADLYSCKGHHTTTTPVSTVYSRSTRPVPMAMLAAMSKASIMRMVPER